MLEFVRDLDAAALFSAKRWGFKFTRARPSAMAGAAPEFSLRPSSKDWDFGRATDSRSRHSAPAESRLRSEGHPCYCSRPMAEAHCGISEAKRASDHGSNN
jgi:hypothetical protein